MDLITCLREVKGLCVHLGAFTPELVWAAYKAQFLRGATTLKTLKVLCCSEDLA